MFWNFSECPMSGTGIRLPPVNTVGSLTFCSSHSLSQLHMHVHMLTNSTCAANKRHALSFKLQACIMPQFASAHACALSMRHCVLCVVVYCVGVHYSKLRVPVFGMIHVPACICRHFVNVSNQQNNPARVTVTVTVTVYLF